MSSISMGHSFHSHSASESSSYAFPPFDGSSSSFAINPASQLPHSSSLPPLKAARTPRTSIVSGTSLAQTVNTTEKAESDLDDEEVAIPSGGKSERNGGVRRSEVWREIIATSNGRDKALKLIQYSIRVFLLFHLRSMSVLRRPKQLAWETNALKRLDSTASGLSIARKCMILFNWITPLTHITAPQTLPFSESKFGSREKTKQRPQPLLHKFLHAPPPLLLDLLSGVSDDFATFYKLGLLPRRIGQRAERMADWCWLAVTIVGLIEVGVERGMVGGLINEVEARIYNSTMNNPGSASAGVAEDEAELEKLKKQYSWLQVSRAKLLMDMIFVSYDCFNLKRYREPARTLSGLASAVLSSAKLFDKQRATLASSTV